MNDEPRSNLDDRELVRQALDGRQAAYGELAARWSPRLLAVCHARIGDRHVAEDLAQETLLRGLKNLASLNQQDKFSSWLMSIAIRVCLDWRKSKQSSQVALSTLSTAPAGELAIDDSPQPASVLECEDDHRQLLHEVELLSQPLREVVMMFYHQDMTYRQIGEVLQISPATVNARLTQARARLRRRLRPPSED